jgi:hypothetical protein
MCKDVIWIHEAQNKFRRGSSKNDNKSLGSIKDVEFIFRLTE